MPATRTSSRQAARKAKEAISDTSDKPAPSAKRKGAGDKAPAPKRGKKAQQQPPPEAKEDEKSGEPEVKPETAEEAPKKEEDKAGEPEVKPETAEYAPKEEEKPPTAEAEGAEEKPKSNGAEARVRTSQEREDVVSSNIIEKGIIYFFYRPRVNVQEAHGVGEVARSFLVLRPTPRGAILDHTQGPLDAGSTCRLLVLPKKKFPASSKERDMGFVEKAGKSMKELDESFIAGREYETSTRGERTVQEAKPYAEGVYAIISEMRSSHLVYILTVPAEIGDIQKDFGLRDRGSWIVQSKNPKFPGPPYARLPKDPEYPEHVKEQFADLRWVPTKPELIDYPNAQFLMIGSSQDDLGRAASAEPREKKPEEEQPKQELEQMEAENESRVDALKGDHTVYEDLGLDAKNYPKVPSTWNDQG
ncbi:hypothetical protein PHISP_04008 [Aspergillus sp. HF37]|nr:hypothetical protein PHISP_04008 [Aspergillus sp. HF37]